MRYWGVFQNLLSQMEHGDNLLLARTRWLVFTEFCLLIAYVLIDRGSFPSEPVINHHRMISVLGVVSTVFILAPILAAIKLFVQLLTSMFDLLAEHASLPMRKLDRTGIGGGLLCPILLSLAVLYLWSRLAFATPLAAWFMTASSRLTVSSKVSTLLSLFVIGLAYEMAPRSFRDVFLDTTLIAGPACLIALLWPRRR